jgi:GNAT superfamily N-acetyltransferase
VLVRPATSDDWLRIWPIFATILAAGETYAYPEDLTSDEARALWLEPPPCAAFVAVGEGEDGTILGSAKAGPNRPGRGSHVATASFMVSPDARGQGVGRVLAEHVLAWAAEEGYRSMQFNAVVESNTHAVTLWQDLGFTIVGTVPQAFDHRTLGLVGLHVMHRRLAPHSSSPSGA